MCPVLITKPNLGDIVYEYHRMIDNKDYTMPVYEIETKAISNHTKELNVMH